MRYLSLILLLQILGCAQIETVAQMTGREDLMAAASIAKKTGEAIRPMNDEEEYFLGRAVASMVLNQYKLYKNQSVERYVNLIGQTVAMASDRPFTHGGYHFALLDSDEINAFACPGGTIFITKGMLRSVRNEDELAAVLAHEVAHVNLKHGTSAVKASRWADVALLLGTEAAKRYTSAEVGKLVSLFEGSIDDVFKTIAVNGYGRNQELAADNGSLHYLYRVGYDPKALSSYLNKLLSLSKSSKGGMFETHPGTDDRLGSVDDTIKEKGMKGSESNTRNSRFKMAIGSI